MNHLFKYAANIDNFNRRFPKNSYTIVNIRYFIIHCHVKNYKQNDADLMLQEEIFFGSLDVIGLESK